MAEGARFELAEAFNLNRFRDGSIKPDSATLPCLNFGADREIRTPMGLSRWFLKPVWLPVSTYPHKLEAEAGFEPAYAVLQTATSPLGHPAKKTQ